MTKSSIRHMSDFVLKREFTAALTGVRCSIVRLLEFMAEFDARRLYLPEGYSSVFAYCVEAMHMSEDSAAKRIRAARAVRRFPEILPALADGRLHLSAVGLLAAHLTENNVSELMLAAAYQTKAKISLMLATRFPQPDAPTRIRPIPPTTAVFSGALQAPGPVVETTFTATAPQVAVSPEAAASMFSVALQAPGPVETCAEPTPIVDVAQTQTEVAAPLAKLAPLSAERFELRVTISKEAHDNLRYIQSLASHGTLGRDVAQLIERALELLVKETEKTKFAATDRPQSNPRPSSAPRTIPAHVKREVWERDQGQCTFIGESGRRCAARSLLEFDHIDEVARGGEASTDRMRLRCRGHNQFTAEQRFGAEFMERKREESRQAGRAARANGSGESATAHSHLRQ